MNEDFKDSEPTQKTADVLHLANWQKQTEGDLEQRQAEQEQAARLVEPNPEQYGAHPKYGLDAEQKKRYTIDLLRWQDEQEQDPEAKDPYGEHWQKLMRGHSKTDLIKALKNALQREQKAQDNVRWLETEIMRLRAENERLAKESDALFVKVEHLKGQL